MELTRHSSCDQSKIPMIENYLNHSYQTATQFEHNFIYSSIRERYKGIGRIPDVLIIRGYNYLKMETVIRFS